MASSKVSVSSSFPQFTRLGTLIADLMSIVDNAEKSSSIQLRQSALIGNDPASSPLTIEEVLDRAGAHNL